MTGVEAEPGFHSWVSVICPVFVCMPVVRCLGRQERIACAAYTRIVLLLRLFVFKRVRDCPGHGFQVLKSILCKRVKRQNISMECRSNGLCTFCIGLRLYKDGTYTCGPGLLDESRYAAGAWLPAIGFNRLLLQAVCMGEISECRVVYEKYPVIGTDSAV